MSNFSGTTHYDSGCESGWTLYLEESFDSENRLRRSAENDGREEGDLSMVSDASSGPPNGFEDSEMGLQENFHPLIRASSASKSAMKSKREEKMIQEMGWNQHSYLDDTASSPVFGFSKKEMNSYTKEGFVETVQDFSQANSRKHHAKKQTGIFQSSSAKKPAKKVSGDFQE